MTVQATAASGTAGPTQAEVLEVRAFNRFYTNVIGVLRDMYLDTPYTLTESRLLYEIVAHGTAEVSWLRQALDIDAGYLSRVLTRFESDGLVTRHRSAADARRQEVRATDAGRAVAAELDERAVVQVGALLGGVDRGRLLDAMRVITEVLGPPAERAVTLRPLAAGDLGWVLQRHGTVYADEFGWDATARLRLLLAEPWARGHGLGAALVGRCLDFARQAGYERIVLLTYDQLAAARRVYRAAGFTLDHEHPEDAFGQHMMCQTWSRSL